MRLFTPALLAAAVAFMALAPAANAGFILGVNFGDGGDSGSGVPPVSDVVIDGNTFTAEPTALATGGLSYDSNFSHFNYHTVFGETSVTPAEPTDVTEALLNTLLLPGDQASGTIHQVVPSGQAYTVTLYYIEGYAPFNRSFDVTGDLTAVGLGLLPYDGSSATWVAVPLITPVITDGSIDFTIVNTKDQPVLSAFSVSTLVPEPASFSLVALGATPLLRRRRV